jgi:hypothetical protein
VLEGSGFSRPKSRKPLINLNISRFDLRDLPQESSLNDVQAGHLECMPFDGEKEFDAS